MLRTVEETRKDISNRWIFTWDNYTDESEAKLKELSNECKWIIYVREQDPSTGTKHLQGFIYLKKRQRGAYLINKLNGACINKAARVSSNDQNEKYTKKEGDYVEYGRKPLSEVSEKKWADARRLAEEGKFDEIDDAIYIKYRKNIEYIYEMKRKRNCSYYGSYYDPKEEVVKKEKLE